MLLERSFVGDQTVQQFLDLIGAVHAILLLLLGPTGFLLVLGAPCRTGLLKVFYRRPAYGRRTLVRLLQLVVFAGTLVDQHLLLLTLRLLPSEHLEEFLWVRVILL